MKNRERNYGPNFLDEDDLSEVEDQSRIDRGEYRRRREAGKRRCLSVGEITDLEDLGRESFTELWRNQGPINLFDL